VSVGVSAVLFTRRVLGVEPGKLFRPVPDHADAPEIPAAWPVTVK
jgi:hypothetical protein